MHAYRTSVKSGGSGASSTIIVSPEETPETEFNSFQSLTSDLLRVPKSEIDQKRREEAEREA